MNKIEVVANQVNVIKKTDDLLIEIDTSDRFFNVVLLNIRILKTTDLIIDYKNKDFKLNIKFELEDNVNLNLMEYVCNDEVKVQYQFFLNNNSSCYVSKFNNSVCYKEKILVELNGLKANFNYINKAISISKTSSDIVVYHKAPKTNSNIKNHVLNIKEGTTMLQVSSYVYEKMIECIVNQDSHIINLTDKQCSIYPNLFIDEENVIANHSANISSFSADLLFYLALKGIDENMAIKMLIKAFLTSNLNLDAIYKAQIDLLINSLEVKNESC